MAVISEAPRGSEAIEGRTIPAGALVGVVQDLSLARDLPTIMEIVRKAARDLTGADGASFVLRDGDQCYYAEENAIAPLWKGRRFPMVACISGWTMLHREAAVVEDVYDEPRVPVEAYRPTFVKSLCMVPIRTTEPVGAIGNYWASRHSATADELALLQTIANGTSLAIENVEVHAKLEKRVRDRTRELEERSRELAEKQTALLDLQRQKEDLSAFVVHDLRSPASAIILAASLQLRDEGLQPAERRRWDTVRSSAEHIVRTAENLLDIAQGDDGKLVPRLEEIDVGVLFAEVRERLLPLGETRGQTIEVSCTVPRGALRADGSLLRRVLQNLVDNALRHNPGGRAVRLEAKADGAWVTFAVCDDGQGIPVEMRERVFERFVQLGAEVVPSSTGVGLGLSFCRMAIEVHGGAVWIEDNVPSGSRFCLRLPAAPH
ncbi:Osmosensitive K+ channel histidine kinase KdpD [Minicystis rosea]|nr:Osmosensitive K+ channel histidine kinase KdpD [Minicystis rosea]